MAQARFCVTAIFSEKMKKFNLTMKKFNLTMEKKYFNLTMEKFNSTMKKKLFQLFLQFVIRWAILSSVPVQHGCSDASMGVEAGWQHLVGHIRECCGSVCSTCHQGPPAPPQPLRPASLAIEMEPSSSSFQPPPPTLADG